MKVFATSLQEAVDKTQGRYQTFSTKEAFGGGDISGGDLYSRTQSSFINHAEQLRYFRGYPHTIIRTICNRISGQPFVVLKESNGQVSKRGFLNSDFYVKNHLPTHLLRKVQDYVPISNHPLELIINRPNQVMTRYHLIFSLFACLELTGRGYWWIQPPENTVSGMFEVWPIPPSWVRPIHKEGCLFHTFEVMPPNGRRANIPASEMAYFFYPDPADPLGACSTIQALAASVTSDEQIELSQARSFRNVFNPGLAVVVGNAQGVPGVGRDQQMVLSADQRNELLGQLAIQLRGSQNSGNPIILDGFIKDVKNIFPNPKEMDFPNSSTSCRNRLSEGFGVNPVSMGRIEPMARASSAVADDHLLRNVVNPRIEIFNEASLYQILPKFRSHFGGGWVAYLEKAVSNDADYDLAQRSAMSGNGAFSRNDWRRAAGMPELEDGDNCFVGGVPVPVIERGKGVPASDFPGSSSDGKIDLAAEWSAASGLGFKSLVQNWGYDSAIRQYDMILKSQSSALQQRIVGVYRKMGVEARSFLNGLSASNNPTMQDMVRMFDAEDWSGRLRKSVEDVIEQSVLLGASLEWHLFMPIKESRWRSKGFMDWLKNLPQSVVNSAKDFAKSLLNEDYWAGMVKTVAKKVGAAFLSAALIMNPGVAVDAAITQTLGMAAAPVFAQTAALTEAMTAINGGQQETRYLFHGLGIAKKKIWKTMEDERVRPVHRDTHDQVRLIDEYYDLDGHKAMFPGDPILPPGLRCGCRCGSFTFIG